MYESTHQKITRKICDDRIAGRTKQTYLNEADFKSNPRAHRNKRCDGSSRGIDNIRQLLARDTKAIKDRQHSLTYDETVRVVVEENEATAEEGGEETGAGSTRNASQLHRKTLDATRLLHDGD